MRKKSLSVCLSVFDICKSKLQDSPCVGSWEDVRHQKHLGVGGGDKCVGGETCHDKPEAIMDRAGVE